MAFLLPNSNCCRRFWLSEIYGIQLSRSSIYLVISTWEFSPFKKRRQQVTKTSQEAGKMIIRFLITPLRLNQKQTIELRIFGIIWVEITFYNFPFSSNNQKVFLACGFDRFHSSINLFIS